MSDSEAIIGIFKEEIKNRFLCTVIVNGTDTVCYIPSSCRLSNFIDLTNRKVLLLPIKKKDSRTKYSVYAIKYRSNYVPVNLSNANRIIENSINRRFFSFLGSKKLIARERVIDGYKSDLYIEDTDTIVEIKSILSLGQGAIFPTVFSERANRQLENIKDLLRSGHKVCYMFVSMYSGVKHICANHEQEEYYRLFKECMDLGMIVCAFSLGMRENNPFVKARVDVSI